MGKSGIIMIYPRDYNDVHYYRSFIFNVLCLETSESWKSNNMIALPINQVDMSSYIFLFFRLRTEESRCDETQKRGWFVLYTLISWYQGFAELYFLNWKELALFLANTRTYRIFQFIEVSHIKVSQKFMHNINFCQRA